MKSLRPLLAVAMSAVLGLSLSCTDAPSAPISRSVDTSAVMSLTDRELLVAVLTKLNALEARFEQEARIARAQLDSLLITGVGNITLAATPKAAVELEASLCGNYVFQASGQLESGLTLWGGGEGMVGVDAYGNGATGQIWGFATQDVKVIPAGGAALTASDQPAAASRRRESAPEPGEHSAAGGGGCGVRRGQGVQSGAVRGGIRPARVAGV